MTFEFVGFYSAADSPISGPVARTLRGGVSKEPQSRGVPQEKVLAGTPGGGGPTSWQQDSAGTPQKKEKEKKKSRRVGIFFPPYLEVKP